MIYTREPVAFNKAVKIQCLITDQIYQSRKTHRSHVIWNKAIVCLVDLNENFRLYQNSGRAQCQVFLWPDIRLDNKLRETKDWYLWLASWALSTTEISSQNRNKACAAMFMLLWFHMETLGQTTNYSGSTPTFTQYKKNSIIIFSC